MSPVEMDVKNVIGSLILQPAVVLVRRKKKESLLPDFSRLTEEERHSMLEKMKCELKSLAVLWPKLNIDVEGNDLQTLYLRLAAVKQQIEVETKYGQFRNMFVIALLLIHTFVRMIMKINCDGFIESQLRSMAKYEQYLHDMASKYSEGSGSLSPEVSLAVLLAINTVVYVLAKNMESILPSSLANQVLSIVTSDKHPTTPGMMDNLIASTGKAVSASAGGGNIFDGLLSLVNSLSGGRSSNDVTMST